MKQTATRISTYSADVMGVCSALFELGGMTVMHDASGCNSTYTTHDEPRWYDMDSMVYISAISEMEAIMGDDEKLISDIADAAAELKPAFIAVAGTPIPTMTGFDFEAVAEVIEQRTGIPSFGFPTTGMNTYIHGASMALAGIAKRFVTPPDMGSVPVSAAYKVNILGLTPLDFSVNGQDLSIAAWLESEGFEVVSKWAMGSSLDEIKHAGEADVNLVVSAAGLGAAEVMLERFCIPYVAGVPVGDEPAGQSPKVFLANALRQYASQNRRTDRGEERSLPPGGMFITTDVSRLPDADKAALAKGKVVIIGEPVTSMALATAIETAAGRDTQVLCATDPISMMLRPKDRITPDEDDIIPELANAAVVIADPLYRPIVPESAEFIALPSEAFSGRIYREDIPDLTKDAAVIMDRL